MPAPYQFIDHPSDIGLIAFGPTLEEAFENAAKGMFSLITDLNKVKNEVSLNLKVSAANPEELLVNWLNELLYLQDTKHFLFKEFRIKNLSPTGLLAEVKGDSFEAQKYALQTYIKAATYNQLEVKQDKEGWRIRVIFDV
jgi:SHS2 domain-containing protein